MRLRRSDAWALAEVLGPRVRRSSAELYLFGSRAKNTSRGGDLDLLVLGTAALARRLRGEKHSLLSAFKRQIGDQRIDLIIAENHEAKEDPFLRRILRGAVLLRRWPRPRRRRTQ